MADKRVLEIVRMAVENKPEQIERTARRLDAYLTKIAVLASTQEVTGGVAMAPALEAAPVAEEAPVPSEQAKDGKKARIKVDRRARRLRTTVVSYAIDHPARLRAVLKTSPQSVKPALLRAIAISETSYEKVLESLD